MFSGIISAIGKAESFDVDYGRLHIGCPLGWLADAKIGDSIAVDGVCLTATAIKSDSFDADLSAETLACCAPMDVGKSVNLEHALSVGDKIGGHIVSGHVDGVAGLCAKTDDNDGCVLQLKPPPNLLPLLAAKGAVALAGVSLTVNRPNNDTFETHIVPHTLLMTTIGEWRAGDEINIEVDIWARQMARFLEMRGA